MWYRIFSFQVQFFLPQSSVGLKAEGLEVRATMQAALNTDWHTERKQTSKQLLALQDCATVFPLHLCWTHSRRRQAPAPKEEWTVSRICTRLQCVPTATLEHRLELVTFCLVFTFCLATLAPFSFGGKVCMRTLGYMGPGMGRDKLELLTWSCVYHLEL